MRIISEIPSNVTKDYAIEQYWSTVFALSPGVLDYVNKLIDNQDSVILYSCSPQLPFDATYIEPTVFSGLPVQWHSKTLFVEPKNKVLVNYTIKKLKPKNLLILNSNIFIRYRLWLDILHDVQNFKKIAERVIVTMPMSRFDFNRLKFTEQEIAAKLGGIIVEDTIVICQ